MQSAFEDKNEIYFGLLVLMAIQFPEICTDGVNGAEYTSLHEAKVIPSVSLLYWYFVHFNLFQQT